MGGGAPGFFQKIPGFSMDDIELTLTGGTLTIKGNLPEQEIKGSYHRRERALDSFSRSLTIKDAIDAETTTARLTDGILTIELPKKEEAKPRQISVTAGS